MPSKDLFENAKGDYIYPAPLTLELLDVVTKIEEEEKNLFICIVAEIRSIGYSETLNYMHKKGFKLIGFANEENPKYKNFLFKRV